MNTANSPSSSLASLFEKIEALTKPQRIAIYAGTLVLLIGLSVYFLIWPKHEEINKLQGQLAKVEKQLDEAKKNAAQLNEWRNKMQQKQAEFNQVMRALPEKEEIPSLLAGISAAGKDAGLEFLLFQPKGENRKDFYAEIPVAINVKGSYHDVAVFFDKVANLPRIVNIRNISMAPDRGKESGGDLTTNCQAVTYKFIEESAKDKGKKGKKRSGRKRR